MYKCDCLSVHDEDPYLRIILNTKKTLFYFCEKLRDERFTRDLSFIRQSRPEMGRDMILLIIIFSKQQHFVTKRRMSINLILKNK